MYIFILYVYIHIEVKYNLFSFIFKRKNMYICMHDMSVLEVVL